MMPCSALFFVSCSVFHWAISAFPFSDSQKAIISGSWCLTIPIHKRGNRSTSTAQRSADGNILINAADALEKAKQYGYNINTNVLEWA
jgi:hypothetical protein